MATEVRLLRRGQVENLVGLSRSEIYRLLSRNQFPVPIVVGARARRWYEHEILEWIESHPRSKTHAPSSSEFGPSKIGD